MYFFAHFAEADRREYSRNGRAWSDAIEYNKGFTFLYFFVAYHMLIFIVYCNKDVTPSFRYNV